jgi:hypothetical protein
MALVGVEGVRGLVSGWMGGVEKGVKGGSAGEWDGVD